MENNLKKTINKLLKKVKLLKKKKKDLDRKEKEIKNISDFTPRMISNSITLYKAFYGNNDNFVNPFKIEIPKSLSTQKNVEEIFSKNNKFDSLPNGFQLYLALFYRNEPEQKYSIHGLWLNSYEVYQGTIYLREVNSDVKVTNGFLIHKINPNIINECNIFWNSGKGFPPSVELWNHEWEKHGTAIQKNIFNDIKPDQFLVTVLDLYKKATTKIKGESLADNFVSDTKKGHTFLIPLSLSLEFEYTGYTQNGKKQTEEIKERSIINT